jgi:hypothetical protein
MKLSKGLKNALLAKLLENLRNGMLDTFRYGYRIRCFDSSKTSPVFSIANPLNTEFSSTYFEGNAPAGLVLDFGYSMRIPSTAFLIPTVTTGTNPPVTGPGSSIKMLGTYTETAKIAGTIDLVVVYAVYDSGWDGTSLKLMSQYEGVTKMLMTSSVVPNGEQGAFVLTSVEVAAGDAVSIADFTINLIEA